MIKVLHFARFINRYDIIDTVLSTLDKNEFTISALTAEPPNRVGPYKEEENYNTRCLNVDFKNKNYYKLLRSLIAEIKAFKPDIIQSHHYHEALMTRLALRFIKVPHWIIGHHYANHLHELSPAFKRKIFLYGEMICNNRADKIIVPSKEVFRILTDSQKVNIDKIEVIPCGIDVSQSLNADPEIINELQQKYNPENKFLALTCCRLSWEKGLNHLIYAVAELISKENNFRLIMVGSGPEKENLESLIRQLKLEKYVVMVGWRNDVMNWMKMADVVVQPSLSEAFCQVLTESLILETPVIMTPVGAAPEVIGNSERGILVNRQDPHSIAEALLLLIKNPSLGPELGKKGKDYVEKNLNHYAIASRHADTYRKVMQRNKS
ncbi:MAG: glycosyltransferase family 4 protein [Bacteroidota bacterium]